MYVATSCVPWEKFRRAMHIPFSISLCKVSTEALAGPVGVCMGGEQLVHCEDIKHSAIYSFFSRKLFLDPLSVRSYLHSLPILPFNGFHHSPLAPSLPSHSPMVQVFLPPSSTMVQMIPLFLPLSSFLLTNGADDASNPTSLPHPITPSPPS